MSDYDVLYIVIDVCILVMMFFGYNFLYFVCDVGWIRLINVKEMGEMEGEKCEREYIGVVVV